MMLALVVTAVLGATDFASEGTLELVIADGPDGDAWVTPYLARPNEVRLQLHDLFGDLQPLPGARVWVEGTRDGDAVWVTRFALLENAPGLRASLITGTAAAPVVRSLNAINVGFQNQPLDTSPAAVQDLRDFYHGVGKGSVADYYAEVSYGKFKFVGDAFIVNLPIDNPAGASCDTNCVVGAVSGALYANYPELLTTYVALIGPFGSSFAQVGGAGDFTGGMAILNGVGASIHELGHLMGNWHTGAYFCTPGPYYDSNDASCSGWQYGPLSAMGTGGGHFQAGQKRQLGWLSNTDFASVAEGVVALAPFEVPSTGLPLAMQVGPYVIENRQPIGVDRNIGTGGLTFSARRSLYTVGSGYTDWVFLKTGDENCPYSCPIVLPQSRVFYDPNYLPAPLWIQTIKTFDEAAMVLVHSGSAAPLVVRAIEASVDGTTAVVRWQTDVASSSRVEFGTRAVALDHASTVDAALVTSHTVTLTNLPSNTHLVFRVASFAGDTPGYAYGELTTLAAPIVVQPAVPPPEAPPPPPASDPVVTDNGAAEDPGPADVAELVQGGCSTLTPANVWILAALSALLRCRRRRRNDLGERVVDLYPTTLG